MPLFSNRDSFEIIYPTHKITGDKSLTDVASCCLEWFFGYIHAKRVS